MATFYVDKRVAVNGNGSQTSPWKTWNEAGNVSIVGTNPTIEIVEGSGPYYPSDCTYLGQGKIYTNYNNGGTATINFNGNVFDFTKNLMLSIYKWNKSSVSGLWYVTLSNGANPSFSGAVKSGIVNDTWDALSTSLFDPLSSVTDTTHLVKWGYGDRDSLGYSTVYIKSQKDDMSDIKTVNVVVAGTTIFAKEANSTAASFILNDGVFMGGDTYIIRHSANNAENTMTINRCMFENADDLAITSAAPLTVNYCYFRNCGHSIITEGPKDIVVNNCFIENCHLLFKFNSTTYTNTVTIRNCTSKNLLAGFVRFETTSAATLVEDHNQIHVDMINIHGGDAINEIRDGYTAKWTTTASSDFPASTATSYNGPFIFPEQVPHGVGATITGLHDQPTATKDFNNKNVLFLTPNIGHIDSRNTKVIDSTDYAPTGYDVRSPAKIVITGDGDIDLSGLTDTEFIDVLTTTQSGIKSFVSNGVNTTIRSKPDIRNKSNIGTAIR